MDPLQAHQGRGSFRMLVSTLHPFDAQLRVNNKAREILKTRVRLCLGGNTKTCSTDWNFQPMPSPPRPLRVLHACFDAPAGSARHGCPANSPTPELVTVPCLHLLLHAWERGAYGLRFDSILVPNPVMVCWHHCLYGVSTPWLCPSCLLDLECVKSRSLRKSWFVGAATMALIFESSYSVWSRRMG